MEYNNGGQYNVEAWVRADTSVNLKLSALLLNGLCVTPAPCSSGDERLTNTLGVNYPGAVWKITVTAMDTTVTNQMAMQLMHSGVEEKFNFLRFWRKIQQFWTEFCHFRCDIDKIGL